MADPPRLHLPAPGEDLVGFAGVKGAKAAAVVNAMLRSAWLERLPFKPFRQACRHGGGCCPWAVLGWGTTLGW